MASIASESNGRRRILFVAGDGRRKTIRLGKASMKQALALKVKIESLIGAGITGSMDDETSRWLAGLEDATHDRLAAAGLVTTRQSLRLGAFIGSYISGRCDVKPATAIVLGHTRRNLIEFFGADKPMREITPGDADLWRLALIGEGLSDNTVRRRCGIAKQFFRAALRRKLIASNPFEDLKAAVQANRSREYFLSRQDAGRVLDACPDAQWRLLFALARFGGLRCPSEHLSLKWNDVDWERGRIRVPSPKTEHHVDGDSRMIPIFPELLPSLREVFEQAEPGGEYIITKYRRANQNLRTQLERIIIKAGLKPWPKLFQNLRGTRETELAERWPEHVVCKWIGNSRMIARKHYLQLTDGHFEQAIQEQAPAADQGHEKKAAHNPAQYVAESNGMEMECLIAQREKPLYLPSDSVSYGTIQNAGLGDTGLEPVTSGV